MTDPSGEGYFAAFAALAPLADLISVTFTASHSSDIGWGIPTRALLLSLLSLG